MSSYIVNVLHHWVPGAVRHPFAQTDGLSPYYQPFIYAVCQRVEVENMGHPVILDDKQKIF